MKPNDKRRSVSDEEIRKERPRGKDLDLDEFDLLDPDPNNLDKEWIHQPRLVFVYLRELADAQAYVRGLKSKLKVAQTELKRVAAQLDLRIRKVPQKYGLKDIKEAAVSNAILLDEGYQEAEQNCYDIEKLINQAEHRAGVLEAAGKALEPNRRVALENLVVLHGRQYFAEPRATGDNKDMVTDMRMRRTVKNRSGR